MKMMHMKKRWAGLAVGLGLLSLAGCTQLNQLMGNEESVNYKSTVAGDPLSIPPDLTQANQDAHFKAPEGTATFSQYAKTAQQQQNTPASERILPTTDKVKVMRDGELRWLVVNEPAEEVYPKVIEFWGEQGFTLQSQDPKAGLIQTDWAENRAKVPEGWLRSALGGLLEQAFDSGERERFRTRIERVNGATEVYISHQHMVETPTTSGDTFKWAFAKEDPGLNAAMLARLMVFLGTDVKRAQTMVEQAEKPSGAPQVTKAVGGQAVLTLNEPFDRAWRRVGVALDSAGFSVDDRDRSTGDYFVRYLDTDTGQKIEQGNFLTRMFGAKNTAEATPFRVHVAEQGGGSVVSILDQNGQANTTETAQRIISVLSSHM